jgi:hypothetical protein
MKKIIIIFLLIFILNSCSNEFQYNVSDHFYDRSADETYLFMFVNVNELNAKELIELSSKLKMKYLIDSINIGSDGAALIHYFIEKDTSLIPKEKIDQLNKKYKRIDIENKLHYIEKGVIFTGFVNKNKSFKDTIFVSDMFIPKKGYKAREIFIENLKNKSDDRSKK